jgi:flavin reductase (DIM6/NTAB) family NADH-FMN oxidoreductase RutF
MQGGVQRDADRFREVLSVMPAGVAVVTAIDDGEPVGFTIGSFLMVSVGPSPSTSSAQPDNGGLRA